MSAATITSVVAYAYGAFVIVCYTVAIVQARRRRTEDRMNP